MIILNSRLKLRGKRYASTDFYLSMAYSTPDRIALLVDSGLRLLTFPIPRSEFLGWLSLIPNNSVKHFSGYSMRRSLTKIKITFSDSTIVYFNDSTMQNFIK